MFRFSIRELMLVSDSHFRRSRPTIRAKTTQATMAKTSASQNPHQQPPASRYDHVGSE